MSVLLFFVVLFVLILVHEWGHFIVAKKTGMRVDEFGIGFPPKLFGVKKGETEYTFNALPIGGFVRILGENGSVEDELSPEDRPRTFNARPKWAQALVLIAGVAMNILFAWFLFALTFAVGVPSAVSEEEAGPNARLIVTQTMTDSPAADTLPVGAEIESVTYNDTTIEDPTPGSFVNAVEESAGAPLTVEYRNGDETGTTEITPAQGLDENNPDRYLVGASLGLVDMVREPIHLAIWKGLQTTGSGLVAITDGLFSLISQSFVGEADFSQVAGPVGIVGMVGDAASYGITALLTFTAIISLNLAVINLLPFPALDGGRLVFVAIEAVTGKQIPVEWAGRVNLIGFAILMLLMIAVTYNDIIRLL